MTLFRCQTFDGGIGGVPGIEAHGGYAFCGLAAMEIISATDILDIPRLLVSVLHIIKRNLEA